MNNPGYMIGNHWGDGGGESFQRVSPTDEQTTWSGSAANASQVDTAIETARLAQGEWARLPLAGRISFLERFAGIVTERSVDFIEAICRETGKPRWEAATEVDAMARKVPLSIAAYHERRSPVRKQNAGEVAATRYKPHGVVAVFGPFNLPGHLPNGHVVPALLAGNTVVFKPSEQAPRVGEMMARAWESAGLPGGVFNLVQGARETGRALASHRGLDGLYFTGSFPVGRSINEAFAPHPGKILALEMGGNNPLVVWHADDLDAAAYLALVSAYITSGQRCSCARRLIIENSSHGLALLDRLSAAIARLRVDRYDADPPPFMGTLISESAAEQVLGEQAEMESRGAVAVTRAGKANDHPAMLTPGLLDVTDMRERPDEEIFGPLLQVVRTNDFQSAIAEANRTRYGLSAGLLSDDRVLFEQFYDHARAGLINWNRPLTGASSALPFGGVGESGNHRPSGSWAADYCSYPVASLEARELKMPATKLPGT